MFRLVTNKQALARLDSLGCDRQWLGETTGYSINSLYNVFAGPERELNDRMDKAFERAFSEEERRREVDLTKPDASVWDLVYFSGSELNRIDRAKKAGGYTSLPPMYRDAVMEFTDKLLGKESIPDLIPLDRVAEEPVEYKAEITRFPIPFLGAVAAGEPAELPRDETLYLSKKWPQEHFVVEVNGRSAEPDYPDGSRWVIDGRNKFTPRNGAVCVVSDGAGSYLKRWNSKKKIFESINPEFNDVIPGEEAKLQGYPVERI